jgi:hypothetical protein
MLDLFPYLPAARRHNAARALRQADLARKIPLRPDPDFRERRLAQFSPERRARYFDNVRKAGL